MCCTTKLSTYVPIYVSRQGTVNSKGQDIVILSGLGKDYREKKRHEVERAKRTKDTRSNRV